MAAKKYTLRIDEDLHAALLRIAEKHHRKLQGEITTVLEEYAAKNDPDPTPASS